MSEPTERPKHPDRTYTRDEDDGTETIPGDQHIVPLADCALCGSKANFIFFKDEDVWAAECSDCGLILGLPYGFGSRLDLCAAWNRRGGS